MIVNDLNVLGISFSPYKAHSELTVYTDTTLPFAITLQAFQLIVGRYAKVFKTTGLIKHGQLAHSHFFYVNEPWNPFAFKESPGVFTGKRLNHGYSIVSR